LENIIMNELHKKYLEKLGELKKIYKKYDFSTVSEELDKDMADISDFKVTVPLVGGFSTGKSSLINELLGYEILSTDITPETAVPAELTYGKENVVYCMKNGTEQNDILNTSGNQAIPDDTVLMKISMRNSFLEQIPDVRLVDMPGFDSGIGIHNRAINDYLPKSLAYIIAVAADDGTLRASVLNFLTELQLNDMPVYIVITKADKCDEDGVAQAVSHIKRLTEQKMNISNLKVAVTSAADGDIVPMQEILKEIQLKSEEIFKSYYQKKLQRYVNGLQSYLNKQITAPDTNLIQVQEDKKLLEEKISDMQNELADEKNRFAEKIEYCIDNIRSKVESELRSSSSVMENILIQGGNISEKVNFIVRNAITAGIREQLEPKLQQYISDISDVVQLGDIASGTNPILVDKDILNDNEAKRTALKSVITPVTTVVATVIGTIIGGPIGPAIGAAVGSIIGAFFGGAINQRSREQEEAQKREAASNRVHQVISEVLSTVRPQIESAVHRMTASVNAELEKAVSVQIEMKKKELADLEANLSQTETEQKNRLAVYKNELKLIEDMMR
ncbi:MAG: dynamin family protein, partial [Lachnospiraceae bacterium]|nr:dynamin family protein [Lachnospiraceae bacterium]